MILAIDPGGTTGIAIRTALGKTITSVITEDRMLWGMITPAYSTIICEAFNPWHAHIDKYGLQVVNLIGGVEALCAYHGISFVKQTADFRIKCRSQARQFLEAEGAKFMVHEVDALAHLLAWEESKRGKVA